MPEAQTGSSCQVRCFYHRHGALSSDSGDGPTCMAPTPLSLAAVPQAAQSSCSECHSDVKADPLMRAAHPVNENPRS